MKRILLLAAMLVMSFCVKGGDEGLYFYWMIDQTKEEASPESFYYAMISVTGDDVPDDTYLGTGGYTLVFPSGESIIPDTQLGTTTEAVYSSLAGLAEYDLSALSFAVELYSEDDKLIGTSEGVRYADLLNGGYIYRDMWTTTEMPYVFTVSVPEPSGGLLVLLGLGALALRRKKEVEV